MQRELEDKDRMDWLNCNLARPVNHSANFGTINVRSGRAQFHRLQELAFYSMSSQPITCYLNEWEGVSKGAGQFS